MSAEEDIPESIRGTLNTMQGKEDPGYQKQFVLFTVVALVSGWATLQLFVRYVHRDAVSATHYAMLFPCGWGLGVFLSALVIFRNKRKKPSQSPQPTPPKGG
jgi:hypothetical protein